jgi:hypothetical protein
VEFDWWSPTRGAQLVEIDGQLHEAKVLSWRSPANKNKDDVCCRGVQSFCGGMAKEPPTGIEPVTIRLRSACSTS